MSVRAAFDAYLREQSPMALARLQAQIMASPGFSAQTPWFARAGKLLEQERFDESIRLLTDQMPGAFFCPTAHQMLSVSFSQTGQTERGKFEAFVAETALQAILSTGSGAQTRPWRVLRVADEYSVVRHLGVTVAEQQAVRVNDKLLDVLTTNDDRELWFELIGGAE